MKRYFLSLGIALCSSLCAIAQSSDPVVMRINGKDVTRSEFEYNFNKNNTEAVVDKKELNEYVELFINYKLKVEAALDHKLDTLLSFNKEFRQYRNQQILPLLVTPEGEEAEVKLYYDNMLKSLEGHDLYLPAHIFIGVSQTATDEVKQAAKAKIDSIYSALKAGAEFEELAKKHSEDKQTGLRGGIIQWIGPHQVLPDMEKVIYEMKDSGEISEPFLSTVGYHIIQLKGRKPLDSYETMAPQIRNFLAQRGLADVVAKKALQQMADEQGISQDQLLDNMTESECAKDDNLKYLVKEYYDGLLLFEECSRNVWEPAAKDTIGIQKFFKKNKKKYAYDKPHFNGMLYHCRMQQDVDAVKSLLKGQDTKIWTKLVREKFNKDSVMVRMEVHDFVQGQNANVDSLVFKVKGAKAQPRAGFPYCGFVGRVLKKGPEKWTDVGTQVTTDYQTKREAEYVAELRKRYKVEVFHEALQTVNKH